MARALARLGLSLGAFHMCEWPLLLQRVWWGSNKARVHVDTRVRPVHHHTTHVEVLTLHPSQTN